MRERSLAANSESKPKNCCEDLVSTHEATTTRNVFQNPVVRKLIKPSDDGSFGSHTSGPIVALPAEPKIVMQMNSKSFGCCAPVPTAAPRKVREVRQVKSGKEAHCKREAVSMTLNNVCNISVFLGIPRSRYAA